jgi:hypothetical protein
VGDVARGGPVLQGPQHMGAWRVGSRKSALLQPLRPAVPPVAEHSARDGTWPGVAIRLEMR